MAVAGFRRYRLEGSAGAGMINESLADESVAAYACIPHRVLAGQSSELPFSG